MENKAIKKGSPTRLQKRAPASLEINKVLNGNPFGEPSKAIPLLSPLIISPQQPLFASETTAFENINGNHSKSNEGRSASSTPSNGWEHPAMGPFPETSALCNVFQKQCVFVNRAQ
ncbi:hypothetical protein RIF29_27825 [Crotalaria pallida]|uniref:Uncharacterized protein n=1 Tax=Crotalaria pallida TaxID=3830 RepID=A0AAN9ES54_CROPI